jgi:hypothetical protein
MRRHSDDPPYVELDIANTRWKRLKLTINPHRFSGTCREKEVRLTTTVITWKARRTNDITPARRWNRRNLLKEIPRRSARTLKEGPERSGIKLINERFAARSPAFEIDDTLYIRHKTFIAK